MQTFSFVSSPATASEEAMALVPTAAAELSAVLDHVKNRDCAFGVREI
jgi:hypothetical protein